jgi:hypothetical protein
MTAAPATGGRSVLLFVRAASLVVAVAASLAAIASVSGVLVGAAVTVLTCAWKYRDPRLTPFFAGVAGAILVAGAAWEYAP